MQGPERRKLVPTVYEVQLISIHHLYTSIIMVFSRRKCLGIIALGKNIVFARTFCRESKRLLHAQHTVSHRYSRILGESTSAGGFLRCGGTALLTHVFICLQLHSRIVGKGVTIR